MEYIQIQIQPQITSALNIKHSVNKFCRNFEIVSNILMKQTKANQV